MQTPHHFIDTRNGDLKPPLLMEDLNCQKKPSSIRHSLAIDTRKALGTSGFGETGVHRSISTRGYPSQVARTRSGV
ncbi:hypothetical protein ACOSP7_014303 [Xanthoceras sorbifolium]